MRGAQRSSLTNQGALLLRLQDEWELRGARGHPVPGRELSQCLADLGITGTPIPRGQLAGETKGGTLQCQTGSLEP